MSRSCGWVQAERILFDQGRLTREPQEIDPATITSWREGRLDFRDEPLHLAVARLSRYTDREITVSDAAGRDFQSRAPLTSIK